MKRALAFTLGSVAILVLLTASDTPFTSGSVQDHEGSYVFQTSGRTIVVTSSADRGPGTFRQALLNAQNSDTINFDSGVFPLDNPTTITVMSPLPGLDQGEVTIDGSDTGVILDGSELPHGEQISGLAVHSSGNVIRGLQILNFSGSGVGIGNGGQHNVIGGTTTGARNIISGNHGGVNIYGSDTMNNTVKGNYIGTDAAGEAVIPNRIDGVWIGEGAHHNVIGGKVAGEGNIISGNGNNGIVIDGCMSNTISGNYIGTDATGTNALGNTHDGVAIGNGGQHNLIGGTTVGERNVISGNYGGVNISGSGTEYNTVSGNYIGTDTSGTTAIRNENFGINLGEGAQNNLIGGDSVSERNLISGNGNVGINIAESDVMNNVIRGNYIGIDATEKNALGNLEHGVIIHSGAGPNIIGPENIIAYNGVDGLLVLGSDTLGNTITGNSVYDNGELGIQNSDGGNTELQAPVITFVGSRITKGTSPPDSTVEIFSDQEDEGQVFEGRTIADEEGKFTFRLPAGRFTGPHITSTATDSKGNTSQFSPPESPPAPAVTRELPRIVAPTQVSVEPKVVGTNLGLALLSVLFFGLTSTVFNSILKDYRDELAGAVNRLIPQWLVNTLNRASLSLRGMTTKGRGRLLLILLVVLLITSIIESFLDPEVGVISPERFGLLLTLFISAVVVNALELGSDLYAHRRWAPKMTVESKVQWIGMTIAIVCVVLSRALNFKPGYLYGILGAMVLTPKLTETTNSGKRAIFVLLSIFVGGFIVWLASALLPTTLVELEPLFLTIFLISLQEVFFQLFPLAVTEGGDIWSWRRDVWFVFFTVVFFCFYHFLLNPNASDVQALQQNGVQTLLILILIFGLATSALWLIFPYRLGPKKAING